MGIFSGVKKTAGKIVDVRVDKWMSLGTIQESLSRTKVILKDLVIPQKASRRETFEEALARLNLTEADIQQRQSEFTRLVVIYALMGLSIMGYALYMIIKQHYGSALVSFCLALYPFGQAFRFHFWLFQLKNRKLGCTVAEWLNSKVNTP